MKLDNLPFHIGATNEPVNPAGLPDTWPFSLHFDQQRGTITQQLSPELLVILDKAYRYGQLIGTPLQEDCYGKPYAEDFLNFIIKLEVPRGAKSIEIGAGVGYLTSRLKAAGLQIVGIEPGCGYAAHWKKNGVEIVNDFFPTPLVKGRFDLICGYAVLEHITEPVKFLNHVRDYLAPRGIAVFSVPDCTDEIAAGDPTILLHEHVSYFDAASIKRLINSSGMYAVVIKSSFARCLYAIASLKELQIPHGELGLSREIAESYPERCEFFVRRVRTCISGLLESGTLGVYCAVRALPILDSNWDMRFFDDDPSQQGKYLPPFRTQIETQEQLLAEPVDNLVIMSRTFGTRIKESLQANGYAGKITTILDL